MVLLVSYLLSLARIVSERLHFEKMRTVEAVIRPSYHRGRNPTCRLSRKLTALKGQIIAQDKRVLGSGTATERRPGYIDSKIPPPFAKPREIASGAATANLICGTLVRFSSGGLAP